MAEGDGGGEKGRAKKKKRKRRGETKQEQERRGDGELKKEGETGADLCASASTSQGRSTVQRGTGRTQRTKRAPWALRLSEQYRGSRRQQPAILHARCASYMYTVLQRAVWHRWTAYQHQHGRSRDGVHSSPNPMGPA